MPKISVIMPVYNSEKYLREAMDSILNQTFTDFEFIILDDGSTDSSPDIVAGYNDPRIRFYQNERNMGVAATLNRGLELATGEYIARMDGDDISLPRRFEIQVAYMDAHPNVAVCGTNAIVFFEHGGEEKTTLPQRYSEIRENMFISSPFVHPSVIMRRSVLERGRFRYESAFDGREDYRLWTRIFCQYELANIKEALIRYRKHSNQVTQTVDVGKYNKHFQLKKELLDCCGVETTDEMLHSLCRVSIGEKLDERKQVFLLKEQIVAISKHMGFSDIPKLYHRILIKQCICTSFTYKDMLRITSGMPLSKRIWYFAKTMGR